MNKLTKKFLGLTVVAQIMMAPLATHCMNATPAVNSSTVATVAKNFYEGLSGFGTGAWNVITGSSQLFKWGGTTVKAIASRPYVAIPLGTAGLAAGLMRLQGMHYIPVINKAHYHFGPLLPDADPSIQARINRDKLYLWHIAKWPTAQNLTENEVAAWNALSNDYKAFPVADYRKIETIRPELIPHAQKEVYEKFRAAILAEKDELGRQQDALRKCLQAFQFFNTDTTSVDEQWKRINKGERKSVAQLNDVQSIEMENYFKDSWSDVVLQPSKFIKRCIYPQEARAARLYWHITQLIARLEVLLEIAEQHLLIPSPNLR